MSKASIQKIEEEFQELLDLKNQFIELEKQSIELEKFIAQKQADLRKEAQEFLQQLCNILTQWIKDHCENKWLINQITQLSRYKVKSDNVDINAIRKFNDFVQTLNRIDSNDEYLKVIKKFKDSHCVPSRKKLIVECVKIIALILSGLILVGLGLFFLLTPAFSALEVIFLSIIASSFGGALMGCGITGVGRTIYECAKSNLSAELYRIAGDLEKTITKEIKKENIFANQRQEEMRPSTSALASA